jgi:hypothetical protein
MLSLFARRAVVALAWRGTVLSLLLLHSLHDSTPRLLDLRRPAPVGASPAANMASTKFPDIRVLRIKKSKNVEVSVTDEGKENRCRAAAVTTAKRPAKEKSGFRRRRSMANKPRKKELDGDSDDSEDHVLESRFRGLEKKSLVEIRRERDRIIRASSPPNKNMPVPPTADALGVLSWFDQKSEGLKSVDPESIVKMLEFGVDKQKKRYDRLVELAAKKRRQLDENAEELEKLRLVHEGGTAKHSVLVQRVEELTEEAAKRKAMADSAEEYTYMQRLLMNRAKTPADALRVDITALQTEMEATAKECVLNKRIAHRRREKAVKMANKLNELHRQYEGILRIYESKRGEVEKSKTSAERLNVRLKNRAKARNRLMQFLNGDHGEEDENKLLEEVMNGDIRLKELENRQKQLIESGKAIEEAFFNMQQMSNTTSLDECVYNFIHREDKYKGMEEQKKRMVALIQTLKEQNEVLKVEDSKAQYVLSNRDLKHEMLADKEAYETEVTEIDSTVEEKEREAREWFVRIQNVSTFFMQVHRRLEEVVVDAKLKKKKRGSTVGESDILKIRSPTVEEYLTHTDADGNDTTADGPALISDDIGSFPIPVPPPGSPGAKNKRVRRARTIHTVAPITAPSNGSGGSNKIPTIADSENEERSGNKSPKSPNRKGKRARKTLRSPIIFERYDPADYQTFVQDLARKITTHLSDELRIDSLSMSAILGHDLMNSEKIEAAQARPGNIRVSKKVSSPRKIDDVHEPVFEDPSYVSDGEYEICTRELLKRETRQVLHKFNHHSVRRDPESPPSPRKKKAKEDSVTSPEKNKLLGAENNLAAVLGLKPVDDVPAARSTRRSEKKHPPVKLKQTGGGRATFITDIEENLGASMDDRRRSPRATGRSRRESHFASPRGRVKKSRVDTLQKRKTTPSLKARG